MAKRNYRKRVVHEDEDELTHNEPLSDIIKQTKELQKFREKASGVDISQLERCTNQPVAVKDNDDPFNLKTGGLVDMDKAKTGIVDDEGQKISLGNNFSAETNAVDEDDAMMKYIEIALAEKRGIKSKDKDDSKANEFQEDNLYSLPENLRVTSAKNSEEMLSNQMLSGIPEIDLGVEAKMKNIEATEKAKMELLLKRGRKRQETSCMVPINMAVNYVQHKRYLQEMDDDTSVSKQVQKKKPEKVTLPVVRPQDVDLEADEAPIHKRPPNEHRQNPRKKRQDWNTSATDDYHFEKFKKHMRR